MRDALIVGAGLGGLSAAIALRQAGWRVRVFERTSSPRELGFGVGLAPNALVALGQLGLGAVVRARGFEPRRGEVRRMDGTVVKRAELPKNALGGPMIVALRPALHGALLDAVGLEAIALNATATGFSTHDDRVTLHLDGRPDAEGDLLVAADGIGSTIRRALHPTEGPPRSSRIVAVRGAVQGALPHLGDNHALYYLGPGVESMIIRASDTGIYWFLSVAAGLLPSGVTDPRAVVSLMSARFDATWNAVTGATDELRYDPLVDRDPLPFWSRGRVTLLGDAAHPVLPHTGQGAAQAIVDAVTLARVLKSTDDITTGLQIYERERMVKTKALLAQGRRTAAVMRTTFPLACWLREVAVRMLPLTSLVRVFARVNRRAGTAVEMGR